MQRWLATRYPIDLNGDVKDSVLIAGVGRSGTTWLAEFINFDNAYRDLFEPFHPWMIPDANVLYGHWYQPLGDRPPALFAEYVDRVLRGRTSNQWINRFNRRVFSRKRLIKAIRANLFLGWLAERYPELKIVHLVRHPAAVAQSRVRLHRGWQWKPTLADLMVDERLLTDLSDDQVSLSEMVSTPFEEYVLTWCLSTWAVLTQVSVQRIVTLFYEDLLVDAEMALKPVFRYLEKDWNPRCLDIENVLSKTARRSVSRVQSKPDLVPAWVAMMTRHERTWVERALDAFGLAHLYGNDGYPIRIHE